MPALGLGEHVNKAAELFVERAMDEPQARFHPGVGNFESRLLGRVQEHDVPGRDRKIGVVALVLLDVAPAAVLARDRFGPRLLGMREGERLADCFVDPVVAFRVAADRLRLAVMRLEFQPARVGVDVGQSGAADGVRIGRRAGPEERLARSLGRDRAGFRILKAEDEINGLLHQLAVFPLARPVPPRHECHQAQPRDGRTRHRRALKRAVGILVGGQIFERVVDRVVDDLLFVRLQVQPFFGGRLGADRAERFALRLWQILRKARMPWADRQTDCQH
jgi:hypothetical protein